MTRAVRRYQGGACRIGKNETGHEAGEQEITTLHETTDNNRKREPETRASFPVRELAVFGSVEAVEWRSRAENSKGASRRDVPVAGAVVF